MTSIILNIIGHNQLFENGNKCLFMKNDLSLCARKLTKNDMERSFF